VANKNTTLITYLQITEANILVSGTNSTRSRQRGKRNTRMSEDVHLAASQGETVNNRARDVIILRKESGMKDVIDNVKGAAATRNRGMADKTVQSHARG
jgi:hypothetical protein